MFRTDPLGEAFFEFGAARAMSQHMAAQYLGDGGLFRLAEDRPSEGDLSFTRHLIFHQAR